MPIVRSKLNLGEWPLGDPRIFEDVQSFIQISTYLIALRTSIKFVPTFYTEVQLDVGLIYKVYAENYIKLNTKRPQLLVNRETLYIKENWSIILEEVKENFESILFNIWAVEEVFKSSGRATSGIDAIAFRILPRKPRSASDALVILKYLLTKLKRIISYSQGKLDQVIRHKGINQFKRREQFRRYLKSKKGKIYIKKCKQLVKLILTDPVSYLMNIRDCAEKYNRSLKFKLLNSLKKERLKRYKPHAILRTYVSKANGKEQSLGIPTMRDRTLQMLLKLVMEPAMEPLGDRGSFGFRPGRSCHQAVSYLHNRLVVINSNKEFKRKDFSAIKLCLKEKFKVSKYIKYYPIMQDLLNNPKNYNYFVIPNSIKTKVSGGKYSFSSSLYLINATINDCLNSISHIWLIKNIPMPKNYEFLLSLLLKPNIVEKVGFEFRDVLGKDYVSGIPQGGIISPLFINWALDGIEELIKNVVINPKCDEVTLYYDKDKFNYLQRKDLLQGILRKESYYREQAVVDLSTTSWVVRYADNFVIGVRSSSGILEVKTALDAFLLERGLVLSKEKTKILKWSSNTKFDFLGWSCHYLVPKRVSWIIKTPKSRAGKLSNWIGNYTYPSCSSIKSFKQKVKALTCAKVSWLDINVLIKSLRYLILGWSNYFSPGPKQGSLRLHLDWYIYKRIKRFIFKKFGHKYLKYYLILTQAKDGSRKKNIGISNVVNGRVLAFNIPRLYDLNTPILWSILVPTIGILNRSFTVDSSAYFKRSLFITRCRSGVLKNKLFKRLKPVGTI